MKRIILIAVVCAFVATPTFADHLGTAQYINVSPSIVWNNTYAGQYNLKTWGLGAVEGDGKAFGTFCLEWSEHIEARLYEADVYTAAIHGGVPGGSDPLSADSAWLYDQYRKGNLAALGYAAWDVQIAIWSIEGEIASPTLKAIELKNMASGKWTDTRDYRVMNLYDTRYLPSDSRYYAQDFIIKVPVPGAVLLGAIGLIAAGRKLRKLA